MKRLSICVFCVLCAVALEAQEEPVIKAAMYLTGASSEEEIPADFPDRLEAEPVVRINSPHLKAGLLLSDYQVACIRDYRASHGDILSPQELSLVDGFGADAAAALSPFLSFASSRLPGQADTVRTRATALLRATLTTFGGKLKAGGESPRTGIGWRLGGAWRTRADGSFYADATLGPWRLLAGDFNARWGQGLAAWSGFSMESLSTLAAFVKRPSGLSPVWSYAPSGVHRGVALSYEEMHVRAAGYIGLHNDYGLHADYLWRTAQVGLTALWADATGGTLALDARLSSRHALFTAELALRASNSGSSGAGSTENRSSAGSLVRRSCALAFKTSASGRWGESWKWAAQTRILPRRFTAKAHGEYGAATGISFTQRGSSSGAGGGAGAGRGGGHSASLTVDASLLPIPGTAPHRFQLRSYAQWQWQISPSWLLDTRLTERYRNYESPRTDLRADLKFDSSSALASRSPASASGPGLAGGLASASGPASAGGPASASTASWVATVRLEAVHCGTWGFLSYVEGGRKSETSAIYLRATGFSIPHWDARIYCYERDAPGTFSVPAYNGRGLAFSAVGSLKLRPFQRHSAAHYQSSGHGITNSARPRHPLRYFSLKINIRAGCQLRTDRRPAYTLVLQLQADL